MSQKYSSSSSYSYYFFENTECVSFISMCLDKRFLSTMSASGFSSLPSGLVDLYGDSFYILARLFTYYFESFGVGNLILQIDKWFYPQNKNKKFDFNKRLFYWRMRLLYIVDKPQDLKSPLVYKIGEGKVLLFSEEYNSGLYKGRELPFVFSPNFTKKRVFFSLVE